MSQNILFFSQHCQHSKKLIAKIINTPVYQSIQKVCVDDPQTRSRLPKWVTCVPMLYLAQQNPTLPNPLKDPEIWMWVESILSQNQAKVQPPQQQFQQQQQNMNNQSSQKSSQPPSNQQMSEQDMGFMPYNSLEMKGGIASDSYSEFLKDDGQSNSLNLFSHSYEFIGGNNQSTFQQPPTRQPDPQQFQMASNNNNQSYQQQNMNHGNGNDSRSSQKQDKFEQELAMKKALRDQDFSNNSVGRKVEGLPQNFNKLWEQNSRN